MSLTTQLGKPNATPVYLLEITAGKHITGALAALTALTVTATAITSSRIDLSWSLVGSATSYAIYTSPSSGGTYTLVTTVTAATYSHTGLTDNTAYYYKVYPVNAIGTGPVSNTATATTPTSATYPSLADGNLISAWLFDEGSGTTSNDSVGTRHLSSVPGWTTPGSIGYSGDDAVTFNGSQNISLADDAGINPSSISIYAWVKTTDTGTFRGVIDKGWNTGGYILDIHSQYPRFSVQSAGGTFYTATATTAVTDGSWHMLAGTFNSATGEVKIYIDGALEATTTSASMGTTTLIAYFAGDGGSTNKLNGSIDTVYLYNDVRSAAEILADWNAAQ